MTAPSGRQFHLVHEGQEAVVVEVGGGLRTYTVKGLDLIEGYPVSAAADAGRGQVLAPWPNRIEDGRYTFAGKSEQLAITEPKHGHAIHGLVRTALWTTVSQGASSVSLQHRLEPQAGFPFTLRLAITYSLSGAGLHVALTATNESDEACPYGAGAHPYLRLTDHSIDDLVLQVPAASVRIPDERMIPRAVEDVTATPFDFRQPRPIGTQAIDHGFSDLTLDDDGYCRVRLSAPGGRAAELWMDHHYRHVMIFTGDTLPPVRRRYGVAIEPMTCPPNAFRTGEDLMTLNPGGSLTTAWGLRELELT